MPEPYWSDGERTIYHGDCLAVLPTLEAESISACATDPPYGWGFMLGSSPSKWDANLPDPAVYHELLRVLKPGGFLLNFCGPRLDTLWRMGRMIEEAGFDVGYSPIWWVFAQGFPKGTDASKQVDRAAGAEREVLGVNTNVPVGSATGQAVYGQGKGTWASSPVSLTAPATPLAAQWDGWKTGHQALKPACEVIVVAQKPMEKGAQWRNVVKHGVGGFNVKGAALPFGEGPEPNWRESPCLEQRAAFPGSETTGGRPIKDQVRYYSVGRHPSNLAVSGDALGPELSRYWSVDAWSREHVTDCENGLVAYCPKASRSEKEEGLEDGDAYEQVFGQTATPRGMNETRKDGGPRQFPPRHNPHPTIKPVSLVAWLLTLVVPPEGIVLDPFLGSGSTLVACKRLGLRAIGIELNDTEAEPYCRIAQKRTEAAKVLERTLFQEAAGT